MPTESQKIKKDITKGPTPRTDELTVPGDVDLSQFLNESSPIPSVDPTFLEEDRKKDLDYFDQQSASSLGKGSLHEKLAGKIAAMVAVMDNSDVAASYERVRQDLINEGKSDEVDRLKGAATLDLEEGDVAAAELIIQDPLLSNDSKVKTLFQIQEEGEARNPVRMEDAFVSSQMLNGHTTTGQEDRVHEGFFRNEKAIQESNSEIEALKRDFALTWDDSTGQSIADFAKTGLIPGFGIKIKQMVDDILPEEGAAFHNLAPGEDVKRFKLVFKNADPKDRVELAKKVIDATEEWSGLIFEDDFEKYDLMETLIGDLNPTDSEIEVDRYINNVFGVLDLIPALGTAGTKLIRTWKRMSKSSTASHMASGAPNKAEEWLTRGLEDEELATAMGTTREEIAASSVFPDPPTDTLNVTPDINSRLQEQDFLGDNIRTHGINYTPQEKEIAQSRTRSRIGEIEASEGKVLLNTSEVEPVAGGYRTKFTVGHTSGYGFESADAAIDAVQDFLEVQSGANVHLLKRDYETGTWKPTTLDDATEGEFAAQVDVKHIYNPEDVIGEELKGSVIGVTGGAAKYFDKSSVFTKWINDAGSVAADKAALVRFKLEQLTTPLTRLSGKKQSKVFEVLDEGDQYLDEVTGTRGKWFPREELVERFGGDESMIQGYEAVKTHQDAIYELQNAKLRGDLDRSGFREIRNDETGYTNVGKPQSFGEVLDEEIRAYDPELGHMVEMTPEAWEDLYNSGGKAMRLRSTENFHDETYDLVLQKPTSHTTITDLPAYMLAKRDGYVTRIYDTTHIIKKKRVGVTKNGMLVKAEPGATFNGKPLKDGEVLSVIKMASNKGEAIRGAKNLVRSNVQEGAEYGVVEARELRDVDYATQSSYDSYRDKGQLYFSHRGDEVEHISGSRTLSGISEALERSRSSVSRHVGLDDFTRSITKRWEKAYGGSFGVGPEGKMPLPPHDIPRPADPTLLGEWKEAIALRDHVAMVAGIDQTAYKRSWKNLVINVSDRIVGTGEGRFVAAREAVGGAILKTRDSGPVELLKKAAFVKFIALNPARQLLLQSQQMSVYLGVEHGLKYFASGAGVRDQLGLILGYGIKNDPKAVRAMFPTIAKGMGMSVKEYTTFLNHFESTGLAAAIDSHPFASAMALGRNAVAADHPFFATLKGGQQKLKDIIRYSRNVGFDAGEFTNISAAWVAARNKWIKTNPGKNWELPDNIDKIAAEARTISFNMNNAGSLAFQKGTMGLFTQFLSHATKSLQIMIPEKALGKTIGKLSNKAFSGKERFRIAMFQMGLYGVGGLGIHEAYESLRDSLGVTLPPKVNQTVREGLNGLIINALFHAADAEGEQTDLSFSENFGPFSGTGSGTPISKILRGVVDGVFISPDLKSIGQIGAGLALPTEIAQLIESSSFIAGSVDVPDLSDPEKALMIMQDTMRLLPGYNNYVKARAAQETGKYASRSGNPTVRATAGEALAQMFFGIRGRKEVEVTEMLWDLRGLTIQKKQNVDQALKETANTLYKNTISVARRLTDGEVTHTQMVEISRKEREALKFALGDGPYNRVMKLFHHRVFSDLNKDGATQLGETLANYYDKGTIPYEDRITTSLRNMPDFEGKAELLRLIESMFESGRISQEVNK